jgi:antirestriction protein
MQILTSALLAAALAGQANPDCGEGTFSKTDHYTPVTDCALKQHNVYYCGDSGTTIVHKQSQIVLRAGKVDSTVLVSCGPHGEWGRIYHCRAGQSERFREPNCKGWPIGTVESIKEL